jgi:hypothetical protein
MQARAVAGFNKTSTKPNRPLPDPSRPLPDARRELFAQRVASGVPVRTAYEMSGYTGGRFAMHDVRRHPAVEARVNWLLNERVQREAQATFKPEKKLNDLRLRVLRRLERIAFGDVRAVASWGKRPILDADGNLTGFADRVDVTPSDKLTHDAAAMVKSVFTKSGELRLELHDPQPALEKLCKALGIYAEPALPPPSPSLTVNIGSEGAADAVRRIAFLLAAAAAQGADAKPEPLTIEGKRTDEEPISGTKRH